MLLPLQYRPSDLSETKFQEEKKETDFEAALSNALLKKDPSLISTRSKDSLGSQPEPTPPPLRKNDSLGSARSKASAVPPKKKPTSIIDELVSRRNEGKLQRTPTFQPEEESTPAPLAAVASKDSTTNENAPPAVSPAASKETASIPAVASVASKDSTTAAAQPTTIAAVASKEVSVVAPAVASPKESVEPAPLVESVMATPEVTKTPTSEAQVDAPETVIVDATPKVEDAAVEKQDQEPPSFVAPKKEDIAEDATEATETEGDVVTEEKNGLVVTSSASEVEVSAGSGFNFCEKFCCGLTLTTAGST